MVQMQNFAITQHFGYAKNENYKTSQNIVKKYLEKWDSLKNYVLQESSLRKLFTETYPENTKMDDVLIKVCSLNDFYSTYIFSPFKVAEHIVSLKIDKRLKQNDLTLVNSIANIKIKGKKRINFYSFATNIAATISQKYTQYMIIMWKGLFHI